MKSSVKINGKDITPSKYHYRHKEDQSPIKVFSFSHRNWTGNDTIKIRLQTMVSDFFLKRLPPNYEQPYALFVSIIDPS
ncbi:MAG: hypothetical protein LBG52_01680 [Candidatus Peribacteria bacterium]|jgi:hypothetical protein|nr:hypothetical protein [Candidatus Peribacteria bacterium]